MKYRIYFFLALCLLSIPQRAFSQSRAKKTANVYLYQKAYASAIPYLRKSIKLNPADDTVIVQLAYCYFYTRQLSKAQKVLLFLSQKRVLEDTLLQLRFELYKQEGAYKEAKKVALHNSSSWRNKSAYCDSAIAWQKKTKPVKVTNLSSVNTEYSEKSPSYSPEGLFFLSNRESTLIEKKTGSDMSPFSHRHLAKFDKDSLPTKPQLFPFVEKSKYHDGEIFFSSDATFAYFSQAQLDKDNTLRFKMFETELSKNQPNKSKSFVFNDSLFSFMHPCIDTSKKLFFFASDMPGGYGGMDLYLCIKIDSVWQNPINLGPTINTSYNELHPFYDWQGRLIFSSDRPEGMGGYDQFVAYPKKGKWYKVRNLKAPINSPNDDLGFVFNRKMTNGYFYSNRKGGLGKEDIYRVNGRLFLLFDE